MALYEAMFEMSAGYGTGRTHRMVVDAKSAKQAALDAIRFIRNRQEGEKKWAEECKDDPDYQPFWSEVHSMKLHPWAPYAVQEDGSLKEAEGFAGWGGFEWKIDGSAAGFSVEEWIEHKLTPEVIGEPGSVVLINKFHGFYSKADVWMDEYRMRHYEKKARTARSWTTEAAAQAFATRRGLTDAAPVRLDAEGRRPA